VTGGWRKLHNETYNIVRVIKPRRIGLVSHVGRMLAMRNICKIRSGSLKGRDHSQDLGVDGRKILEWMLEKYGESCGPDSYGSGYGTIADSC